jgi:hypothetical protein
VSAVPLVRRLWGVIKPGAAGREVIHLTKIEPDIAGMSGVLLLTGMLADDDLSLELDLISDPKADPDLRGHDGPNGWTPILAGEADGTRTLLRVVDWVGGQGAKPALGYVGAAPATGLVVKGLAFNFNAIKRVDIFAAVSAADGIAAIVFDPPFATVPAKALPMAVPNLLAGPVKAEVVAGSLTKSGCKVKVSSAALVTGVVTALAGATASVIVIEA